MSENRLTMVIRGTPFSPGLAQGLVHAHYSLLSAIDAPVDIEQTPAFTAI